MVSEFGWRSIRTSLPRVSDEQDICNALHHDGAVAFAAGGRNQSHDLEVTHEIDHVLTGKYEVKRLSLRPGGHSADRRFKAGRRGETIYGRRDAEIKCFATALEDFLDEVLWSEKVISEVHDFIDQALQRRHGKKFHDRLLRLADKGLAIPNLLLPSTRVLNGGIRAQDIQAGFAGLSGIFIIVGHIYTLVKPSEYTSFVGFDSACAEGPKLSFHGVIPLETFGKEKGKK